MWCGACQQDVPGVAASLQDRRVCCARCGQPLAGAGSDRNQLLSPHFRLSAHASGAGRTAEAHDGATPEVDTLPDFEELEDWDFAETIRHTQHLVSRVTSNGSVGAACEPVPRDEAAERAECDTPAAIPTSVPPGSTLPWLILALGIGVFACGAALMGLSLAKASASLWQLALPMVLGGQLAVLFVVIWQLDVVWHSNRTTFVLLDTMDKQLRRLHVHAGHAPLHAPAAKTIDQHVSDGASAEDAGPHGSLDDLRAQLDALAVRLDHSRDAA